MLSNPKPGQPVTLHYAAKKRSIAPLHGCRGVVQIVSRKRPRNHGVVVDGSLVVVPAGNLKPVEATP